MPTFGACEIGAIGNSANTFTTIGSSVTLAQAPPTNYKVWRMGASIISAVAVDAERFGGQMRLNPATPQDWAPVPTPLELPTPVTPSQLGTTTGSQTVIPATPWWVNLEAKGGTIVDIQAAEAVANNAAAIGMGFFFYGDMPPWARDPSLAPMRTVRRITGAVDSTSETSIGTVQVGTGDTLIQWIGEVGAQDAALTADQEVVYRLRLTSEDTDISNFRFPGSACFMPPEGTLDVVQAVVPIMWPVNIPIKKNSTLEVLADHQIATNTVHTVFIATV